VKIVECVQYSPEWWQARAGVPTVSQFAKVATKKGIASESRRGYINQLAVEYITGKPAGSTFMSYAMKRGHEEEGKARSLFAYINDIDVIQTGLIFPDEQRRYGASPDGLLVNSGLEIYCPESPVAVECFLHPEKALDLSGKYQQIQGSLLISEYDFWNFMVYYDGLDPLIMEIPRDEKYIDKLRKELDDFVLEVVMTVKQLKARIGK